METQDKLILLFGACLVCAGIVGFYMVPASNATLQIASIVAGVILGAAVILFSVPGRRFISYAKLSVAEAKKVVWPSPHDAARYTGLVIVFVFVLALFMWLLDTSLSWFFYDVLLRRG